VYRPFGFSTGALLMTTFALPVSPVPPPIAIGSPTLSATCNEPSGALNGTPSALRYASASRIALVTAVPRSSRSRGVFSGSAALNFTFHRLSGVRVKNSWKMCAPTLSVLVRPFQSFRTVQASPPFAAVHVLPRSPFARDSSAPMTRFSCSNPRSCSGEIVLEARASVT